MTVGIRGWAAAAAAFAVLMLTSCASVPEPPDSTTAVVEVVAPESWPVLSDDLDFRSLLVASYQSLAFFEGLDPQTLFDFGPVERTAAELARGVRRFREIVGGESDPLRRTELLKREFILLRSSGRDGSGEVLFTGYYEPLIDARSERHGPFEHPVYGVPDDLVTVDLESFGFERGPRALVGRVDGGKLIPYADRGDIDFGVGLSASAEILGYVDDPVDVFFLHVQGSGTLVFDDGHRVRAGYATSNGHAYRSIGKLLLDEGLVSREEMSMQAIRTYLAQHPEEIQRVLSFNPSYIFFRKLDPSGGPLGCYGLPVTPGRSIATDSRLFSAPVTAWIEGSMPAPGGGEERFSRFVLNQDTGGSITGPGRVDLFIGAGDDAGEIAGRMQNLGRLYLLLPSSI